MEKKRTNVKKILFQGVFWRILAIEAILLAGSLIYRELTESPGIEEQFWYAMRIILLIGIIILFMMVTLRSFLTKKIISPLESIVSSNHELAENNHSTGEVNLPDDAPLEIKEIVSSRTKMLNTILTVSEERLRLVHKFLTTEPPQTVMMKGLKSPLVNYSVTAIGPPYDIDLHFRDDNQNGIQLSLPFHCWKVEDKKIAEESCLGETIMLNENVIVASIKPPLEPLTDIKLRFDFCMEAHCFDDIYGKILPPTDHDDKSHSQLRITSIKPVDRDILKKWMEEAG